MSSGGHITAQVEARESGLEPALAATEDRLWADVASTGKPAGQGGTVTNANALSAAASSHFGWCFKRECERAAAD